MSTEPHPAGTMGPEPATVYPGEKCSAIGPLFVEIPRILAPGDLTRGGAVGKRSKEAYPSRLGLVSSPNGSNPELSPGAIQNVERTS